MKQVSIALGAAGLVTGFILALGVLSGDSEGRVNLLYLLMLFAFLPVLGLVFSVLFLLRSGGRGLAGWLLELPLWPSAWRREIVILHDAGLRKYWLFYQTQIVALAFGTGGMLGFLFLLLGSDVSFVWRSTVLQATDLLPTLQFLAMPWRFWSAAQPELALLQQSQDFRLATPEFTAALLGQWWKYALAAQLSYNILPRAIMLLIAGTVFRHRAAVMSRDAEATVPRAPLNAVPEQGDLAPLVTQLPADFYLLDWAQLAPTNLEKLTGVLGQPAMHIPVSPLEAIGDDDRRRAATHAPVLLVKGWEPPMGELYDFLHSQVPEHQAPGVLLPLDWDDDGFKPLADNYLAEWRRFAGNLDNWSVMHWPNGSPS